MEDKLKTTVLKRSLKVIEDIYNEAMYDNNDIYRVKDVIHSLDSNHWRNKEWAVHIFSNLYRKSRIDVSEAPNNAKGGLTRSNMLGQGKFLIVGGWYGLLAYCLKQEFPQSHVISSDMDPECEKIGNNLFHNADIDFQTFAIEDDIDYDVSAIFCTSVEHIDPKIIQSMIDRKGEHTWVVLQSTNYNITSHINTHETYEDLEKAFTWSNNEWGGAIQFSNSQPNEDWLRHMVIAR